MSCESVRRELLSFHFGEISEPVRREVEAHLEGCPACLLEYLEVKRGVETAEEQPRPSFGVKTRLREAVARELGLIPRPGPWWERPLALGFACAAVGMAMIMVHWVATGAPQPPHDQTVLQRRQ
jgi:anti-sigma factor RsiW